MGNNHRKGFASMDKAKQREIARKGGKAAHASGGAHEWDSAEAREAGRKGQARRRGEPTVDEVKADDRTDVV
jgi:hypothetical protein